MIQGTKRRLVVGITGATGAVYGLRLLEALREDASVEAHLVVSRAGALTLRAELNLGRREVEALADVVHSDRDVGAAIASGSFRTSGLIIAPCSVKTLAAVATGVTDTLIARAADVALKERRRTVLLVRESPLNLVHLRNMVTVTEMGGIIMPPVPVFYAGVETIEALVDQTIARVLDLFDLESPRLRSWAGLKGPASDD
ncbi:MAG TPA: UbiX family flavin prenyltransferase [Gammaproteobacteria bacterium]|nr:UbiX family flavin prenyltransferase [Gammaproteobacteria bacterium]